MLWNDLKLRIGIPVIVIAAIISTFAVFGLNPIRGTVRPFAPSDRFIEHLDVRIPELMALYRIPGSSIALVKEGQIIWTNAYGYADRENGRKMTADTPMRVQSISKPVTTWGVMRLVEQGKIDLDAPAVEYLKSWQFPQANISAERVSVRQLLSHTAGLPLGDVFTIYSPKEAMPSLEKKLTQEAVLMREPGTAFSYSNTGYNLVELLIEDVTGQNFAEYMEREILTPLGMNHSTFMWSEEFDPAVPVGYDLHGRPVPVYVYPEKASGGLFSTAEDVAVFAIAGMPGFSQQILSPGSIETMYMAGSRKIGIYSLVFDGYGLGHYIERLPKGKRAISHGGQGTGIMTHFHAVPETGDAIVILTNSQRSWPFISYILRDWGKWNGFPSVGMGRIIWGIYGLWAVIGIIWSIVLFQVMQLAVGITGGRRKIVLHWNYLRPIQIFQLSVALALMGGLYWCVSREYLFLTSVFPRASMGLAISAAALALILLLSAVLPAEGENGS
ncbi:MAG: serine hydrolase domain-containing protein [Anaerovoracaceae bacterium]